MRRYDDHEVIRGCLRGHAHQPEHVDELRKRDEDLRRAVEELDCYGATAARKEDARD